MVLSQNCPILKFPAGIQIQYRPNSWSSTPTHTCCSPVRSPCLVLFCRFRDASSKSGHPWWDGTPSLVPRAFKLISERGPLTFSPSVMIQPTPSEANAIRSRFTPLARGGPIQISPSRVHWNFPWANPFPFFFFFLVLRVLRARGVGFWY